MIPLEHELTGLLDRLLVGQPRRTTSPQEVETSSAAAVLDGDELR
jgi:hypothetical protein